MRKLIAMLVLHLSAALSVDVIERHVLPAVVAAGFGFIAAYLTVGFQ
jgi:hypothetical protein